AQANVWTEVMQNRDRADYQVFPRLATFAEVVWPALPPPAGRDSAGWEARTGPHHARPERLGATARCGVGRRAGPPRLGGRGRRGAAAGEAAPLWARPPPVVSAHRVKRQARAVIQASKWRMNHD
ncbi:hypothetical protein ADK56_05365, partial [Streptomyces sp. MMG1522]|uniref:family 20 glycosylhydrolase n=1 Tax=Streptomyces sp. MMG1522 TaxID=1415545 RepID=UPI0006C26F94